MHFGHPISRVRFGRNTTATPLHDDRHAIGEHCFETEHVAVFFLACLLLARKRFGMTVSKSKVFADRMMKNIVACKAGMNGAAIAMPQYT